MLDPLFEQNPILNVPISHCEVKKVVNCAKTVKAQVLLKYHTKF